MILLYAFEEQAMSFCQDANNAAPAVVIFTITISGGLFQKLTNNGRPACGIEGSELLNPRGVDPGPFRRLGKTKLRAVDTLAGRVNTLQ